MPAYIIGTVTVTDPSWVESYIPNVQAQVEAAGGRYISRGEPEHLEGEAGQPSVAVIIEFADKDAARAWYDSSEYAPYREARQAGSTGDLFLLDGL